MSLYTLRPTFRSPLLYASTSASPVNGSAKMWHPARKSWNHTRPAGVDIAATMKLIRLVSRSFAAFSYRRMSLRSLALRTYTSRHLLEGTGPSTVSLRQGFGPSGKLFGNRRLLRCLLLMRPILADFGDFIGSSPHLRIIVQ